MPQAIDLVALFRRKERSNAIVDRGGFRSPHCDMCGKTNATDYHEIASRGRTMNNNAARTYSFHRELCAFLCNQCHLNSAHNPKVAEKLLLKNCKRYGWLKVRTHYDALESLMKTGIHGIPFPPDPDNRYPEE